MSEWIVQSSAVKKAEYLGLAFGDEATRVLSMMATESAQTTHKRGNRRYGSFVLNVKNGNIVDVFIDDISKPFCSDCYDSKVHKVYETCEVCEGEGCEECFEVGGRIVAIRCQTCK